MAHQPTKSRKFLAGTVTAALVATAIVPTASAAEFNDTAGNTHEDAINALVDLGVINGYPDGSFQPNKTLSRSDVVKMMGKWLVTLGYEVPADYASVQRFDDVSLTGNQELLKYAALVKDTGVFNGSEGKLDPTGSITRENMALVLVRAFDEINGTDLVAHVEGEEFDQEVTDLSSAKAEARPFINVLDFYDITSVSEFMPKSTVTRGQFATFLYKTSKVEAPVDSVEVASVSAINAKQVEVKFSVAVDKATVLDSSNVIKNMSFSQVAGAGVLGTLTGVLSEDGKTLTVTAANIFDGDYTFQSTDAIKSSTGVKLPVFTSIVKADDTVAPSLVSASAVAKTTTNSVTLAFSEPVQATGVIVYVNGSSASVSPGAKSNELVLTTGTALAAGSTNQLSILNVKDFNGNFISPNPLTSSFTVVADTAAPTVTAVNVVGENQVEVTYSKAMSQTSFVNNARLLDANGVSVSLLNASVDGKKVTLTTATALTYGPNGTFTGNLLLGTDISDTLGNKTGTTYSQSVTFTKDTVAPSVASVAYASGNVNVTFNENVTNSALDLTGATVINNNTGVVTPLSSLDFATPGEATIVDNKLVLPVALAAGDYTLRLPADVVKDLSISGNKNVSAIVAFNVSATAPGADSTVPSFVNDATFTNNLNVAVAGTNLTPEQTMSYVVQDASGLDLLSVRDVNNYTLDGKALPVGSYVTTNYSTDAAALTVTIHVDSSKVTASKATYKLVASNIKDKAGNIATPQVSEDFALIEGVKPELSTATVNNDGSTSIGFTENLQAALAVDPIEADLVVNVNGAVVDSTQYTLAPITIGAEAGKYLLTVQTSYDAGTDFDAGTNGSDGDGDETIYIDVDASGTLNTGDIIVSTGTFTSADAGNYNLNSATTLKVGTIATGLTGADAAGNTLKASTTITVK